MATGQLVTCILTARDGRGEPLGFGGDKFLAAVRGPGHVASEIFDRGDGTYEVVLLAPPLSGEYSVSASLHGEQVGGAPHRLTVLAPRAHPPCCVVDGAGAELASAGDRAAFCVRAHDAHGNALTFGGDRIEVTMRRDSGTAEEAAAEAAEAAAEAAAGMQGDERRGARDAARGAVPVAVKDERDGRYTCSYTAYRAGAYTLSVALRGETLPGSPFRVHVAPAGVHAGACVATGDGMQKATAGVPARFALALRDPYGNVLDCASQRPASWACALRGPNGVALHATLSDRGDGRIAGEYTALVAGDYTLSLTLGTLHVKASPAAVRVGPGAPHAPSCSVEQVRVAVRGEPCYFTLTARDAWGNACGGGGHALSARLRPPLTDRRQPQLFLRDLADGTVEASFTPVAKGAHLIACFLGADPVRGSDFAVVVE